MTTAPQIQTDIDVATAALTSWNSFVEKLTSFEGPNGETFDLEKQIPNLTPQNTISQLEAKMTGAIALAHNLSNIESLELIPDAVVSEVTTRVNALRTIVDKLLAHVNAVDVEVVVASFDSAAMTAANEQGQQINLPPIFLELYPAVQSFLTVLYQIRAMVDVNEEGGLGLQLSQLDAARSAQRRAYGELNRLRRAVSASRRQLESLVSSGQSSGKEIDALKDRASANVTKTEEAKSSAEVLLAATNEINIRAQQLRGEVDGYLEAFNKFQEQLSGRNLEFEKGSSEQARLLREIVEIEKEISRLRDRSRDVLGEATMSGLSESFAREKDDATKQLFRTQLLFFFSIALLLVSAGVILNAFPFLEEHGWVRATRWEPPVNGDSLTVSVLYLGNIVSKAIFLLPSVLLLAFAGRRYSQVFRLKTLYTYKYTIAASLPGFKIEAPTYAEGITASAFKELLFNPDDAPDGDGDKSKKEGNTFLQSLIEPVVKRLFEKMSDIPKPPPGH